MTKDIPNILDLYDYRFPAKLIAQAPASPRDSARLLVYDRKTKAISHDAFRNLANHLPKNAVLIFNQTKVIPARFTVYKPSGGKVILLYLSHDKETIRVLSDRKLELGTALRIDDKIRFAVVGHDDKWYTLKPNFAINKIETVLQKHGRTPLPPYIKHTPLNKRQLEQQYQTVFAKTTGSVAAPTASLHFSSRLMKQLKGRGITIAFVTLHIGLGTFAPVTPEQIKTKKLHREEYKIDKKTASFLNKAKRGDRPIIAVGTTAVRTLESASDKTGQLKTLTGSTDLFIQEYYKPKFVSGMITNFHVPRSSLLMLVSAFTSRPTLMKIYKQVIAKKYKLFSFGDGMLIL